MFLKVNKPKAQIKPNDYALHDVRINLSNTTNMDKVKMMEENLKAVSSNFIKKSCLLDNIQAEITHLRDQLDT